MLRMFPAEEGSQQTHEQQKWLQEKALRQVIKDMSEKEDLPEVIVKLGRKGVDYAEDNVVSKAKRD
eukprot:12241784-Karenia_brevis.AAC.1